MTSLAAAKAARERHAAVPFDVMPALEQRARLLEAIWADVLGPRLALASGALPPATLARLRLPLRLPRSAPSTLPAYAADLVCCADGAWRVARDRVGPHPGAALLEAPVLSVFLPALSRLLRGEPLLLPSTPARWLADPATMAMLSRNPASWCIRDAFDPAAAPIPLATIPLDRRLALQARLDTAPESLLLTSRLDHAPMMLARRSSRDKLRIRNESVNQFARIEPVNGSS